VAVSTQNQAFSAVLFLYREVLRAQLGRIAEVERAQKPRKLPLVLTPQEVEEVLRHLEGAKWLMASLLYGAGLRLLECLRLRVKDVDFAYLQINVRDGKGMKDRVTMLPMKLVEPLQRQLAKVRQLHERDLREGFGETHLPFALARKYPKAGRAWAWQYVFPAGALSLDPRGDGARRRHHATDIALQRAVKRAVETSGIAKPAGCHTFSAFVCDALAREWLRYPDGAGVVRSQGCEHDDGLHARPESAWSRGKKPPGLGSRAGGEHDRTTPRQSGAHVIEPPGGSEGDCSRHDCRYRTGLASHLERATALLDRVQLRDEGDAAVDL
jgi:integrase